MHRLLQSQAIQYKLYIISQEWSHIPFNRGALLNVGYKKAMHERNWDCLILHDVDLLPESINNSYTCLENQPTLMYSAPSKFNFTLPYKGFFGGVVAVTPEQFVKANGFSNSFFGWGAEDDDFESRLKKSGYKIGARDNVTGRYYTLRHDEQVRNPKRMESLSSGGRREKSDGLTSANKITEVIQWKDERLYTNITVKFKQ